MDQQPKVSVIIPVYNTEKYLRQCLDSVTGQTLREIEIICVDDGSTDRSLEVLKQYAAEDSRITVLTQKNLYAGAARNQGLAIAKGEYLSFLDSDDFFDASLLEKLYRKAKDIDADVVICSSKMFHQDTGKTTDMPWMLIMRYLPARQPFSWRDIPGDIFQITSPAPWSKLFKRAFIQTKCIEFQSTRNSNDLYFTNMAFALADRIGYVNESLVHYRVAHGGNLQAGKGKSPRDFYYALCAIRDKLREEGLYHELEESFLKAVQANCDYNFKSIPLDALNERERDAIMKEFLEKKPKVSIIVPVYNTENYLTACLDSLISQTIRDIEIICVNDGSTDRSYSILQEYAKTDRRVTIVNKAKNEGTHMARKSGVQVSRGEFVMFVDADDYISPKACETAYNLIVGSDIDILQFGVAVKSSANTQNDSWHKKSLDPTGLTLCGTEILDNAYKKRTVSTALWGKIYSGALCKRACHCMPDIHCFVGEDIFSFFFLAFYSKLYKGVRTEPLYWYRYGTGVSNQEQMSCEKFENYCKMGLLPAKLQVFVRKYATENIERAESNIDAAAKRMLEDCCRIYSERMDKKDKKNGADLLVKYWGSVTGCGELLEKAIGMPVREYVNVHNLVPLYTRTNTIYAENGLTPKVSVVIPVFNVEQYLQECLNSVLNQTLREIEIICVNDGSYDNSLQILEQYAEKDERISVISQRNRGQSAARNAGLQYAHGKYIYFLDSDDYILPDALEKLYTVAQENDLEVLYFGADSFFESVNLKKNHSSYVDYYHRDRKLSYKFMSGEILFHRLVDAHLFRCSVPLQLISFDLLQRTKLQFKEGIIHEDELFSPILLLKARRAGCIADIFYMRRVRGDSTMTGTENDIKRFEGYFVASMDILAELLLLEGISQIGQNALLIHLKNLYRSSMEKYQKLRPNEISQLTNRLPEKYKFLLNEMGYGKNLSVDKIQKISSGSAGEAELRAKIVHLNTEITNIHHSWTYRIGRFVTFVPRKVRGGIRCYKEHGMRYTLRCVKEKIFGFFRR